MEERRAFPRKLFINKIEYVMDSDITSNNRAYTYNICLGGVGVSLDKHLEPGKKVIMVIHDPNKKEPVMAEGHIIWSEWRDEIKEYRSGVEFTGIRWNDIKNLTAAIFLLVLMY